MICRKCNQAPNHPIHETEAPARNFTVGITHMFEVATIPGADWAEYFERVKGLERDAMRYRRLRVLGVPRAGIYSNMLCFTNLDAFVDDDIAAVPSRGEAKE